MPTEPNAGDKCEFWEEGTGTVETALFVRPTAEIDVIGVIRFVRFQVKFPSTRRKWLMWCPADDLTF